MILNYFDFFPVYSRVTARARTPQCLRYCIGKYAYDIKISYITYEKTLFEFSRRDSYITCHEIS